MFLRKKGQGLIAFVVMASALIVVGCSNHTPLDTALQYAGDNRPELKAVLDHYKDNPEKLAAAKFLIENMPAHRSYKGDEIHQYYEIAKGVGEAGAGATRKGGAERRARCERSELTGIHAKPGGCGCAA